MEQQPDKTRKKKAEPELTPAQLVFIEEMVKGRKQATAYMIAYPDSSRSSAYASASRLMYTDLIANRIDEGIRKKRAEALEADRKILRDKINMFQKDMEALRNIIHSGMFREVTNKHNGRDVTEKHKDDPSTRVKALALNLKYQEIWNQLLAEAKRLDLFVIPEPAEDDVPSPAEKTPLPSVDHTKEKTVTKSKPLTIEDCGESPEFLALLAEHGYHENFKKAKKT